MSKKIPDTISMPLSMPFSLSINQIRIDGSEASCVPRSVRDLGVHELTAKGEDFLYVNGASRFSGFSGLFFSEDGFLTAISDRSYYVHTGVKFHKNGTVAYQSSTAMIGTLKGEDGEVLSYEGNDVEDVAQHGGDCFIPHEIINLVSRYSGCDFEKAPQQLDVPHNISRFSSNLGMESLVISGDGTFLSMQEYDINNFSNHSAFLWSYTDEKYNKIKDEIGFTYTSNDGYSVSGITFTCQGHLLLLERKIVVQEDVASDSTSKYLLEFESRVKFIPQSVFKGIAQGDVVSGTEIIHIHNHDNSIFSDNFEGIAVQCSAGKDTIIYLISDDNQSPTQKNLLRKFEMREDDVVDDLMQNGEYHEVTTVGCEEEMIYPFCAGK